MVSLKSIAIGLLAAFVGVRAYDSPWKRTAGQGDIVSFDGRTLCVVTKDQFAYCATNNLDTSPNWRKLPGTWKWIVVWGDHLWAVNPVDDIYYGKSVGDPAWQQIPGKSTRLTCDGKQLCGITAKNDLFCADDGIYSKPNWRQLDGKFKSADVTDGVIYGVTLDGSVYFGMSDGEPNFTKIYGNLEHVAFDGELLCGYNKLYEVWCADSGLKTDSPNWRRLEGRVTFLEVNSGRLYGIGLDTFVWRKWMTPPPSKYEGWRQLSGKLRQINFDGKTLCGVTTGEDVYCATDGLDDDPSWKQIPGVKMSQVVVWGDNLYGVNSKNELYYNNGLSGTWTKQAGTLKSISTDGKQLCGISPADEIWCADANIFSTTPAWRQIPGKLKVVKVANGALFGVDGDGVIFIGRAHGDPQWVQLEGKGSNVDYDGGRVCVTNDNNEIYCANDNLPQGKPNWKQVDGQFRLISVNANNLFALTPDNDIYRRIDM